MMSKDLKVRLFPYTTLFRSSSFGNGGKVLTAISTNDQALAAMIQSDGKILAAGVGYNGFALVRYNSNGSLDSSKPRSEEHTSELQSRLHLVCRLLLEKKKEN